MFLVIVPQQSSYLVEFLGKYSRTLGPGLHFIIPFIEKVRYWLSLKEDVYELQKQSAVTRDNVIINIDGVLYFKVSDPHKAAYGSTKPI